MFSSLVSAKYPHFKALHPTESRRAIHHRILAQFLTNPEPLPARTEAPESNDNDDNVELDPLDPFDAIASTGSHFGILVRTDYTDEDAWNSFAQRLQEAENELQQAASEAKQADGDVEINGIANDEQDDEGSEDEEQQLPCPIIAVLNPVSPQERAALTGITNLTALRLLNDVNVRQTLPPPPSVKKTPGNPLISLNGWQQIYTGRTLWIFDSQSNIDQSVRMVNQKSDDTTYGSATADSWRVRASHLCEMQVSISVEGVTIDFGGMDRWDYAERQRNLHEALQWF